MCSVKFEKLRNEDAISKILLGWNQTNSNTEVGIKPIIKLMSLTGRLYWVIRLNKVIKEDDKNLKVFLLELCERTATFWIKYRTIYHYNFPKPIPLPT